MIQCNKIMYTVIQHHVYYMYIHIYAHYTYTHTKYHTYLYIIIHKYTHTDRYTVILQVFLNALGFSLLEIGSASW